MTTVASGMMFSICVREEYHDEEGVEYLADGLGVDSNSGKLLRNSA